MNNEIIINMSLLKATKKEKKPLFYRQTTFPSRVDWLGIFFSGSEIRRESILLQILVNKIARI